MAMIWQCACGWSGNQYALSANSTGHKVCPSCGGSGGLVAVHPAISVCKTCLKAVYSKGEIEQGECSTCEVASWTPEKRAAMGRLIGMTFRTPKPSPAEIDSAIDDAFKEL